MRILNQIPGIDLPTLSACMRRTAINCVHASMQSKQNVRCKMLILKGKRELRGELRSTVSSEQYIQCPHTKTRTRCSVLTLTRKPLPPGDASGCVSHSTCAGDRQVDNHICWPSVKTLFEHTFHYSRCCHVLHSGSRGSIWL